MSRPGGGRGLSRRGHRPRTRPGHIDDGVVRPPGSHPAGSADDQEPPGSSGATASTTPSDARVKVGVAPKAGIRVILSDPAVRVAILIIFVVMAGFGIIAPILPLYARSFGVSYQAASLLI